MNDLDDLILTSGGGVGIPTGLEDLIPPTSPKPFVPPADTATTELPQVFGGDSAAEATEDAKPKKTRKPRKTKAQKEAEAKAEQAPAAPADPQIDFKINHTSGFGQINTIRDAGGHAIMTADDPTLGDTSIHLGFNKSDSIGSAGDEVVGVPDYQYSQSPTATPLPSPPTAAQPTISKPAVAMGEIDFAAVANECAPIVNAPAPASDPKPRVAQVTSANNVAFDATMPSDYVTRERTNTEFDVTTTPSSPVVSVAQAESKPHATSPVPATPAAPSTPAAVPATAATAATAATTTAVDFLGDLPPLDPVESNINPSALTGHTPNIRPAESHCVDSMHMTPDMENAMLRQLAEDMGYAQPAQQTTTKQSVAAATPASPAVSAPSVPATTQVVAAPVAPVAPTERTPQSDHQNQVVNVSDSRDELSSFDHQRRAIRQQIETTDYDTGIIAYKKRDSHDPNNLVHEVIHALRWEPETLFEISIQKLSTYEPVIASAQAYVQTMENQWRCDFEHLGRELDRVIFIRRESYPGATKTEKENNLIAADPDIRRFRNEYIVASAMKTYLENMGKSFVTMANSIKRTIDVRHEEMRQAGHAARHTT